MIYNTIFVKCL